MGVHNSIILHKYNMKVLIALCCLLVVILADERSHQSIQHGHAPPHGHQITKGHHDNHAIVHQQPHTAPQDVHNPYHGKEKYHVAAVHPAHGPSHRVPASVYQPHKPASPVKLVYTPSKPVYHAAPKALSYEPEPAYNIPAHYSYEYAVNDDYAKTYFSANEARDGYNTNGEYRVALPDGRTQVVKYNVADAYSGYVAEVSYEGKAAYAHPEQHSKATPSYHS